MVSEELIEKLKNCKSLSEAARILGYNYYNGGVKLLITHYCSRIGIDIEGVVNSWKNRKTYCLNCGKELTGKSRFIKKFCNSSCSASYTNRLKLPKSDEERNKIANSLYKYRLKQPGVITLGEAIESGYVLNPDNVEFDPTMIVNTNRNKFKEKTCPICGKTFKPFLNESGRIYQGSTCSKECHKKLSSKISKESQERVIAEGRHKGWSSRNIESYPEKFWKAVLENNNIGYKFNHKVGKYFLDFDIDVNGKKLDLEIDGSQHYRLADRIESDKQRDIYLKEIGYIVYRIPWNEISKEEGKEQMKKKIDDFLEFYSNL